VSSYRVSTTPNHRIRHTSLECADLVRESIVSGFVQPSVQVMDVFSADGAFNLAR